MAAQLTYIIFTGRLRGFANGRYFDIYALSGGGGGSKDPNNPDIIYEPGVINNPYMTWREWRKTGPKLRPGGPIPWGRYKICRPKKHPVLGFSARLEPQYAEFMYRHESGAFYIHNRGRRGSSGCIVPMEKFHQLMNALTVETVLEELKIERQQQEEIYEVCGYLFVEEDELGWRFA